MGKHFLSTSVNKLSEFRQLHRKRKEIGKWNRTPQYVVYVHINLRMLLRGYTWTSCLTLTLKQEGGTTIIPSYQLNTQIVLFIMQNMHFNLPTKIHKTYDAAASAILSSTVISEQNNMTLLSCRKELVILYDCGCFQRQFSCKENSFILGQ